MASLPKFGMDKELADKENAKRDIKLEAQILGWVSQVTGQQVSGDFIGSLKNGVVLCQLMNSLIPGSIPKYNQPGKPFKEMENISMFLTVCRSKLRMHENDLFTSADLYDEKSPVNVASGIVAVSRAASKNGFKGPSIAPKESAAGKIKRWSINARNGAVSMLNMGSAGIMDKNVVDTSRNITFGAEKSGPASNPAEMTAMMKGSNGIMQRSEVSTSNSATFGADSSGVGSSGVSKMNMGSYGIMEKPKLVNLPRDVTTNAN